MRVQRSTSTQHSSLDSSPSVLSCGANWSGWIVGIVCILWCGTALAVPPSITHQGRLMADDGPMTGEHTVKFTIWDQESGGMIIWESPEKTVDLGDTGFYSVTLGTSDNPLDPTTLQSDDLWIELVVDGGDPLSPRIKFESVPYAVRAGQAESVAEDGVTEESIADGAVSSSKLGSVQYSDIDNTPATIGGLSCSSGQVGVWDGSNWSCGSQASYSAGSGLSLNGNTFSLASQSCTSGVAVGIQSDGSLMCQADQDTTYDRTCPSGEVVGALNPDGSVVCVPDEGVTAVNANSGLQGGGTSGSVGISIDYNDIDYSQLDYTQIQQRLSSSCPDGQVLTGIQQNGSPTCEYAGASANPSSSSDSNCGEFVPAQMCPAGDTDGPSCSDVNQGAFCEGDSCNFVNNSLDNCGIYDWYIKTGP